MTQPTTEADQLDEESLAYELAAELAVTAALTAWVASVVQAVLALYTASLAAGTLSGVAISRLISSRLSATPPSMRAEMKRQVDAGVSLGLKQGAQVADVSTPKDTPKLSKDLSDVLRGMDPKVRSTLNEAIRLSNQLDMEKRSDVLTVVAKATQAATQSQADARWLANRALNEGIAEVARKNGDRLVWVAERDACLNCLAYAGLATAVGKLFPADLTFGDKPLDLDPVPFPPLHPNCRCRVQPYDGPDRTEKISDMSVASVLYREARRTVIRGWSDHASEPARLRAADRLIQEGANLPKTVVARGAEDVRRGSFSQRHKPVSSRLNA